MPFLPQALAPHPCPKTPVSVAGVPPEMSTPTLTSSSLSELEKLLRLERTLPAAAATNAPLQPQQQQYRTSVQLRSTAGGGGSIGMQMQMRCRCRSDASLSTRLITPIAANVRFPSPPPLHPLRATPPPRRRRTCSWWQRRRRRAQRTQLQYHSAHFYSQSQSLVLRSFDPTRHVRLHIRLRLTLRRTCFEATPASQPPPPPRPLLPLVLLLGRGHRLRLRRRRSPSATRLPLRPLPLLLQLQRLRPVG